MTVPPGDSELGFLAGTGEMAARIRAYNWEEHPLGPPAKWPQSLKIVIRIMLTSRYAMWMGWGKEFYFFCNDAYLPTVGLKRDWVLGTSARKVWAEIWPDIGPRAESVVLTGNATWDEALLLFLQRSGYSEETYHTFSYSPVPDDHNSVGGMLCVVTEETDRVIGERRLAALRDVAAEFDRARNESELFAATGQVLTRHAQDVPFGLIYLFDQTTNSARLACAYPAPLPSDFAPENLPLNSSESVWPVQQMAAQDARPVVVPELAGRFESIPHAAWDRSPDEALVMPIMQQGLENPAGCFIAGLNPFRRLDAPYRSFLDLLTGQMSAALSNTRAYEQERRRAEALAELDRAKTAFFSNISHEFRTPLTLILGPIEEELRNNTDPHEGMQLAYRSSLRLLKLVNTLLDFSRIEAGRMDASYEATDLAAVTKDLASVFRSAVEKAGLRLVLDCPPLPQFVYVDREMWEKIVMNLLSNALKFTFEGKISVEMRAVSNDAEISVRDTGVGIPETELPKLFERFHRVRGTKSRTFEGTGIGLALVQELVQLHKGTIQVKSIVNQGTTFTVRLPFGQAHLPADRISRQGSAQAAGQTTSSFVQEALRWLPEHALPPAVPHHDQAAAANAQLSPTPGSAIRILLADDNADMREYVRRLLAQDYQVEAVGDGNAALAAIQDHPPDLILSDVMMPGLDGFGLLELVRNDEQARSIPFILLSARAGEEARVEGLGAGADEYLTKPFSARELLARVRSQLEMSRLRREAFLRERELRAQIEAHADELEKVVARRTAKLQETVADLEHFSYAITHDMRAPLRAMQGFAAMIEEESGLEQFPLSLEYLKRIKTAAVRLDQLITDSLNYSKAVRHELPTEPVDLAELLPALIDTYPNLQPDKADIEIVPGLPVVLGNAAGLTQCFSNLLGNAVKFGKPRTRPQIRIHAERLSRPATGNEVSPFVRIWVEDNGIGIPSDSLERIFGMFQRAAKGYEGTGIGLAIARKVVERMGGKMGVQSEQGKGSKFWVDLPPAPRLIAA